jgi:hypothetical protein
MKESSATKKKTFFFFSIFHFSRRIFSRSSFSVTMAEKTSDRWKIIVAENKDDREITDVTIRDAEKPENEYKFEFALIHGVYCFKYCPFSRYQKISEGLKYRPSDIIVSTYPKCGTTWIEQVVLLLKVGDPSRLDPVHRNAYNKETGVGKLWPDAMLFQDRADDGEKEFQALTWEDFDFAPSPRIIKTHHALPLLLGTNRQGVSALPNGTKVIVVSRNPYDACVSGFHHFGTHRNCPFDAWATLFLSGTIYFGSYFDWLKGWYAEYKKYPDRILWIEYEQMKKDPLKEIKRVAAFIDNENQEEDFLQRVVDWSSLDKMKQQAEEKGGDIMNHLRKGVVGDWRNYFSEEMYEKFRKHAERELEGIDLILDN